jgi:hypothetical protein
VVCVKFGSLPGDWRGPKTAVQVREADNETDARREEMRIAMSNALALMRWHDIRFIQDFSGRDFAWLLIGVLLAVVAIWAFSHRRRRWF